MRRDHLSVYRRSRWILLGCLCDRLNGSGGCAIPILLKGRCEGTGLLVREVLVEAVLSELGLRHLLLLCRLFYLFEFLAYH